MKIIIKKIIQVLKEIEVLFVITVKMDILNQKKENVLIVKK
jgi:hypothetical protein